MKKAKLFVCFILGFTLTACTKSYSIDDVVGEKGMTITKNIGRTIDIAFNKVDIPNDFNSTMTLKKEEVLAYRTDTSYVYVESITSENDYYIFHFNIAYQLDHGSYATVPYHVDLDTKNIEYTAKLKFTFLDDGYDLYDNALYMQGNGNDEKFSVAIKKDVYQKAQGIISFTMVGFYDLSYTISS